MRNIDFGRVMTAMVTPFDQNGNIDYEAVERLVNHLIANGSDTILVSGTTGEGPTITKEEKIMLFTTIKQLVGNRVKVIANVGTNDTKGSIEMAKQVETKCGVDGLLVVAPYYNKPNQEGIYLHIQTVAESVNLPIMIYNIPGRTGVNIEAETIIRLSKIDNVIAVKESSGNLDQMATIIENTSDEFKLYCGDDNLTLPVIAIGGYGVVSVASHFFGRQIQEMIANKDAKLHRILLPIFKALFIDTNPIGTKYLLSQNGLIHHNLRLPLVDTTQEKKETLLTTYTNVLKELKKKENAIN